MTGHQLQPEELRWRAFVLFLFFFPFVCPLTGVMFLRWFLVSCPGFVHPAWPECQPRPWPLLFYQSLTSFPLSSSASSFLPLLSLLAPSLNERNQHGFPSSSLLSPPSFHLWFPLCACKFLALTSNMSVRLHPSPHLLITQQIHANMYLWLSWGTYVIICKNRQISSQLHPGALYDDYSCFTVTGVYLYLVVCSHGLCL